MKLRNSYYASTFFWTCFQRILNAIVGFISVPMLLSVYGKADYGIISIATACNGYMHLLDLGMNTGAVRFFSQWRTNGQSELINRVARTNITFYLIIAVINAVGLLIVAFVGEGWFSVSQDEFLKLQKCLIILAIFCVFNWSATTFNQLLVANKMMSYTLQLQSVISLLKIILVGSVIVFDISLTSYFFILTLIISLLLFPYADRCKRLGLIDSFKPSFHWDDYRVVLTFSLSIFALSVFQMTATQSRPIVLSIFACDGAEAVADFRILEVVPQLIIMIGGTFSGIFLPKTSEMVATGDKKEITKFAYKWTTLTSVLACVLCFPFMICARNVLIAYVGSEYEHLSSWLVIWCVTVLLQIHTTPGNSLILAYGKTKLMVYTTIVSCILSIIVNAFLCQRFAVGSAVIGYLIYVVIQIALNYLYYYKKLLNLSRMHMSLKFIFPVIMAFIVALPLYFWDLEFILAPYLQNDRLLQLSVCVAKSAIWFIPYLLLLQLTKTVNLKSIIK